MITDNQPETYAFVIDDDEISLLVMERMYLRSELKYPVKAFSSGKEFLEFIESHENVIPKLIFLDMFMKEVDGLEVLKSVRSMERFNTDEEHRPHIVMVSSSDSPVDIMRSKKYGADSFLTKPGNVEKISEMLTEVAQVLGDDQASA